MLYEQYFLYFFKFENKAITYVLSDRASTFDYHCMKIFSKSEIKILVRLDLDSNHRPPVPMYLKKRYSIFK